MKRLVACVMVLWILCGCGGQAGPVEATQPEEVTLSVTKWTDKSELFMEHPLLVAGKTGRFAVHFTNLKTFKPATDARVVVALQGESSAEEFVADPQTRPGIFGVDVTPKSAGSEVMSVRIESSALTDTVEAGLATIYPNEEEAAQGAPPEPTEETIAFLKEQQWALDYATALTETRALRSSFLVPAEVTPRTGGSVEVTVPFNGRLVASRLPVIGSRVTQGQVVAELLPPTSAPSDLASIESERSQAAAAVDLARKDRERAERLLAAGAVPARRVDEARAAEATAEARLRAANTRLGQYDTSSAAEGSPTGAKLFALRAPISGTVAEAHAAPGANMEAGEVLLRIVDLDTVYVSAIVPESEFPRISALSGAELEIPGVQEPVRLQRLVSVGHVVDPASRTFPVIYEVDNRSRRVAVNQTVHVRLFSGASANSVVVPESAIVDDAGRPIVFVQVEGESFVRKPVTLGVREGGAVQVVEGLQASDRVVTRGGNLIRLASMSSQVPAHGHVH
jgi:RND family efflux transporter MFP subunit